MSRLEHFQKYKIWYEVGALLLLMSIASIEQATTVLMDNARLDVPRAMQNWEPFVWEFSSGLVLLLLIPVVVKVIDSSFINWSKPFYTAFIIFIGSLLFSATHVGLMVGARKLIYSICGMQYEFGSVVYGFFYEYRKDLTSLIQIVGIILGYRFIVSRMIGEASLLTHGEQGTDSAKLSDRILVKKLGKEFVVKISDIEWLEASGNYVNLHLNGRIYPTRNTLVKLMGQLTDKGFCRIHRSYAVNLDHVESIETLPSGGGDLTLDNGKVLKFSRSYHEEFKKKLKRST